MYSCIRSIGNIFSAFYVCVCCRIALEYEFCYAPMWSCNGDLHVREWILTAYLSTSRFHPDEAAQFCHAFIDANRVAVFSSASRRLLKLFNISVIISSRRGSLLWHAVFAAPLAVYDLSSKTFLKLYRTALYQALLEFVLSRNILSTWFVIEVL